MVRLGKACVCGTGWQRLIDVSKYPTTVEVPSFQRRAKCGGKRVDVRPNWKEQLVMPTKLRFD